jgi:hypothetical protein
MTSFVDNCTKNKSAKIRLGKTEPPTSAELEEFDKVRLEALEKEQTKVENSRFTEAELLYLARGMSDEMTADPHEVPGRRLANSLASLRHVTDVEKLIVYFGAACNRMQLRFDCGPLMGVLPWEMAIVKFRDGARELCGHVLAGRVTVVRWVWARAVLEGEHSGVPCHVDAQGARWIRLTDCPDDVDLEGHLPAGVTVRRGEMVAMFATAGCTVHGLPDSGRWGLYRTTEGQPFALGAMNAQADRSEAVSWLRPGGVLAPGEAVLVVPRSPSVDEYARAHELEGIASQTDLWIRVRIERPENIREMIAFFEEMGPERLRLFHAIKTRAEGASQAQPVRCPAPGISGWFLAGAARVPVARRDGDSWTITLQ